MGLKPLRHEVYDDISMFLNATGDRGLIVTYDTTTTGLGGMDDANAMCQIPTTTGGVPVGMLMNDVDDIDQSRFVLNWHQDTVQKNSKVNIMRRGFAVTNSLVAGLTPTPGNPAYYTTGGLLTTTVGSNRVGTFTSGKDADGYAKVEINIL